MLVERHAYALSASANGNTGIAFAFLDSFRTRMREIRIIAAFCGIRPELLVSYSLRFKIL